jgi:hypothetical protein
VSRHCSTANEMCCGLSTLAFSRERIKRNSDQLMMFGAFVCRNGLLGSAKSEFQRVHFSGAAGRARDDFMDR